MTQKKGGKKGKSKAKAAKRDPAEPHLHKDGALYIIRPIPERNIQQLTALQQQVNYIRRCWLKSYQYRSFLHCSYCSL
jgi:hypothetical protein